MMIDAEELVEELTRKADKLKDGLCNKQLNFEDTCYERGKIIEIKHLITYVKDLAAKNK